MTRPGPGAAASAGRGGFPRRVLHVAPEGLPFSKTGGLADVIGALPAALVRLGVEVAVLLPGYPPLPGAPTAQRSGRAFSAEIPAGHPAAARRFEILEAEAGGVRYWLLESPELFEREALYADRQGRDFPDNWLRYAAFARVAGEIAAADRFDLVHCHDWQSALVPVYEAARLEVVAGARRFRTLLTIHNIAYQGLFPASVYGVLRLPARWLHAERLEFYGGVNYLKGGILAADALTTVSPTYAREILTPEFGAGLEGVLVQRQDRLTGILNGVDYADWDPRSDPFIVRRYGPEDLRGKQACKLELQEVLGLDRDAGAPLAGIVSRLAEQKGWDLLVPALPSFLQRGMQLAALGSGEARFEEALRQLAWRHPGRVGVRIGFDVELAHRIEAGADLFLMPSRYEPCGLNQMYSLRYGTVPVVRATGGLADTVVDASDPARGTGFVFREYSVEALSRAIERALATYGTRVWRELQLRGMAAEFSWDAAAAAYLRVYRALAGAPAGVGAPAAP